MGSKIEALGGPGKLHQFGFVAIPMEADRGSSKSESDDCQARGMNYD